MKAITIQVFGKVQGVWFRASTKRQADLLGVAGTVSNQPDGSVLIHALGKDAHVEKLVAWCHQGPTHAQVTRVEVKPCKTDQTHDSFCIIR